VTNILRLEKEIKVESKHRRKSTVTKNLKQNFLMASNFLAQKLDISEPEMM
jgi:hypothetical protein